MQLEELRAPENATHEVITSGQLPTIDDVPHGRRRFTRQPHVVIVGAGLAGLSAAYEIQKLGWTYTILEAEIEHVGGRVRTAHFKDGSYGELGAMRIPAQHERVWKYVKEFHLPTRSFVTRSDNAFYFARGRRVRVLAAHRDGKRHGPDGLTQAYRLRPDEARAPDDLWNDVFLGQIRSFEAGEKSDLQHSDVFRADSRMFELDHLSLRRMIQLCGFSNEAINYLFATSAVGGLQHSAVTELLREELTGIWSDPQFFEIVGGMERFPKALLDRLHVKPRMGCAFLDFRQDDATKRVTAIYRNRLRPDILECVEGDFLICTIPFSVLALLEAHRRFTAEKQLAIRELRYESAIKLLVPTTNRFWESKEKIFGGATYTDLLPGSIYYPSDNVQQDHAKSQGPGVLTISDCWGQEARWLGNMIAAERERLTVEFFGRSVHEELIQPGVVRWNETKSWYWDGHPWAGGAFAFYMPGQFAAIHRTVTMPEGRIHFAGEHCSRMHSWMEGALASAHAAVSAIVQQANEESRALDVPNYVNA